MITILGLFNRHRGLLASFAHEVALAHLDLVALRLFLHGLLGLNHLEVFAAVGLLQHLALLLVTMVDQCVDLLDQADKLLLLRVELILKPVEADHHGAELLVSLLLIGASFALIAVKHLELVLELFLNSVFRGSRLVLLLTVDSNKVCQVRALLALTDLNDDAHNNILESVLAVYLIFCDILNVARHVHHVVARELALLLQDLVLVYEKIAAERIILVLLDQLFHLAGGEDEELGISLAAQVNVHEVLHEEATMVDGRTLVELLEHELVVLKLGKDFHDTLLDEVERVGRLFLIK